MKPPKDCIQLVQRQLQTEVSRGCTPVFICRLAPVHIGHQIVIRALRSAFPGDWGIIVGSSNQPASIRHLFTLDDRLRFLRGVGVTGKVASIPDFPTDDQWFNCLESILSWGGFSIDNACFIGGTEDDVRCYKERGHATCIIRRFEGHTPEISGTKIRDCFIRIGMDREALVRKAAEFLDDAIVEDVVDTFMDRWREFSRR